MIAVLISILSFFAKHGRLVLVVGLIAGVALPDIAAILKPYLPQIVAITLFLAALRIGPVDALGKVRELRGIIPVLLIYQIAVPLVLILILPFTGLSPVLITALTLMAAAPSISGSPNLTIMLGHNPAPALRMLVSGTAIVPLTALVVFPFVPEFGSAISVAVAAFNLLLLIAAAAGAAFLLRIFVFKAASPQFLSSVDGLSAIAMAGIVIGLMTAIGPALHEQPSELLYTLMIASIACIGLQIGAYFMLGSSTPKDTRVGQSIISGCRNNALFIAALPVAVTDPLLLYIGCYQIPMYLTPLLLKRFYR